LASGVVETKNENKKEDKEELTASDNIVEKKADEKKEQEKKAITDGDVINAVLAVCENEEEKCVAALSQDQLGDEIGAKIKAGEIDASVRLGHLWMEIHARALKKHSA